MMTSASAQSFAVWLLREHPALFYAAAKHVNPNLGGFADILSNVGGAFSSAVSSVGSWISNPQNLQSLTSLAGTYFAANAAQDAAKAQLAALNTQSQRAQAGQLPAPISYTYDAAGNPVPVYTGSSNVPGLGQQVALPSGQVGYTLTGNSLAALRPSFIQKYGLWLVGAGAAAIIAFSFAR